MAWKLCPEENKINSDHYAQKTIDILFREAIKLLPNE